ncbi:hypothetical protein C8Q77DRAFT_1262809 [Trametes polyzona]|nr:hypothetical protein C8Q77DRAFT_1262809 [Trametes polyzona]
MPSHSPGHRRGRRSRSSGRAPRLVQATQHCLPPEAARIPAPFLHGNKPRGKPKAGDYEPHVAKMINAACHQFDILVFTEQAFPDTGTSIMWAARVWEDVCRAAQTPYKIDDRIEKIVTARASHARGSLRDKLRPLLAPTYGFKTGEDDAQEKNIEKYNFLLDRNADDPDPRFHYEDVDTRSRFARNSIITTAIQLMWFADASAPGIKYAGQFSPIRDVTLAILFTTIEFCLDQWATGHFDKHLTYTDKAYRPRYEVYLTQIRDWCKLNDVATKLVRQRLYDRARRSSGAPPEVRANTGLSEAARERLRAELAEQDDQLGNYVA